MSVKEELYEGDERFIAGLSKLPPLQQNLGKELLKAIREVHSGKLKYFSKSKKYVESPDNFWVVKIQPRAKSLRIVVYGSPNRHRGKKSIELKDDMTGYSSFLLDNPVQLAESVSTILQAAVLKQK